MKHNDHEYLLRMPRSLAEQGAATAAAMNVSFADFCRQSIRRNIHIAEKVEQHVLERAAAQALGRC